jgi:hypothetical protein
VYHGVAQHVVGPPAHDFALQLGEGFVVDDGAQGAGGENIGVHAVDGVPFHGGGLKFLNAAEDALAHHVGDDELRAGLAQVLAQEVAHIAHALHGDGLARHAAVAVHVAAAGLDGLEHPQRGKGRRVPRAPGQAHHMGRFHVDVHHVLGRGAHVSAVM